jgi:hypothetical protein
MSCLILSMHLLVSVANRPANRLILNLQSKYNRAQMLSKLLNLTPVKIATVL